MNRIYQGRVKRMEFLSESKQPEILAAFDEQALKNESGNPLWDHHCIFQDAVNYYLVALAALADPRFAKGNRLMADLRKRLAKAWDHFPRTTQGPARSLRSSLTRWLDLSLGATIEDACAKILEGNEADCDQRIKALLEFLDSKEMKKGEVRNAAKNIEWFVLKNHNKNYPSSPGVLLQSWAEPRLPVWINETRTTKDFSKLQNALRPEYFSKLNASSPYIYGPNAIEALKKRIEEFDFSDKQYLKDNLLENLKGPNVDAEDLAFPSPAAGALKGSAKDRFSAFCFFKFISPSEETFELLATFFKEPSPKDIQEHSKSLEEVPGQVGESYLKQARGDRGFIFPAFTSLQGWPSVEAGSWNWKGFDINAFEEALKAVNQFSQKTLEREKNRRDLKGRLAVLLGKPMSDWKPGKSESGEEEKAPEPLDSKLFALARQLEKQLSEDLAAEELNKETTHRFGDAEYSHQAGEWQLSRASLRGFREIAEEWNKLYEKCKGHPPVKSEDENEQTLTKIVKDFQRDEKNKKIVGSLPLFFTLCEEAFWDLWKGESTDLEEGETQPFNTFLYDMVGFHQTVRDWERSREPINLTPAEPSHSRRLYMFSDVTDKRAKVRFADGENGEAMIECAIAYQSPDGVVREQRVRLHYSAPRLRRDNLLGGEPRWLQPMMDGLGLEAPKPIKKSFMQAVSLMPDKPPVKADQSDYLRMLLNFPLELSPVSLINSVYKLRGQNADVRWDTKRKLINNSLWQNQFHENWENQKLKSRNWLLWPGVKPSKTMPELKTSSEGMWWRDPAILAEGFTTLSVDLGQRTAGAWALLRVTCWDPRSRNRKLKRPVRKVGHDGDRSWYAEVVRTGLLRLPGEDQKVQKPDGSFKQESFGKSGRNARQDDGRDEYQEGLDLARALMAEEPENWVGNTATERSFPEQNDALLALANRRLSRLNTFHRWSCFEPDRPEVAPRRDKLIGKLREELEHWRDETVREWKQLAEAEDWKAFQDAAGKGFEILRKELGKHLVTLANRVAPLRDRSWEWKIRQGQKDNQPYHELTDTGPQLGDDKAWIRGQRGLSMQRLEQLERLRTLFLRHNRSFDRQPGKKAKFGRADRGRESGEPCSQLLAKIDRMKEQRINQTAHLILAQALGVRLKAHEISETERKQRDFHGEYERIPGREPVDFIVIENLDRYLTSQGRGPSENSRLMKWAHRAVRDKIKMLAEEPFGIPVVETAAAYSSRFCARTSEAGFRLEERPALDEHLRGLLARRAERPSKRGQPDPKLFSTLLRQFERLEELNAERSAKAVSEGRKAPSRKTLFLPKTGGPLFMAIHDEGPTQADGNAAVNLGLRAIAAPDALDLIHKLRTERANTTFKPQVKNAREKALARKGGTLVISGEPSGKLQKSRSPNFFVHCGKVAGFDLGTLSLRENQIPVVSGVALWSAVNSKSVEQIVRINNYRLNHWGALVNEDGASPTPQSEGGEDRIPF